MPTLDRAEVAQLIQTAGVVGEDNIDTMVAIAKCESGYRTTVENHNSNGTWDTGLWQINSVHRTKHPGWTRDWLKSARNNAQAARTLYQDSRFRPWRSSESCWSKEVGASRSERDTNLGDIPVLGEVAETAQAIANGFKAVVEGFNRVGRWVSEPHNWTRVGYVAAGTTLVLVAGAAVAGGTKAGQTVTAVVTKGAVTKGR